jgi:hypothetical protein
MLPFLKVDIDMNDLFTRKLYASCSLRLSNGESCELLRYGGKVSSERRLLGSIDR